MSEETSNSVLVVDDEPQVVWMLQFSLEAEGYQTYSARDGRSALDEVREHHPELMLLDIMMPVMDGWAVLEELQGLPRDERPRVIVVSARTSLRDKAKAAELGADAFVTKPFNVDDLLLVLHDLERSRSPAPAGSTRSGPRTAGARATDRAGGPGTRP
jgi:DNA-binding response OmpR family regulator